MDSFNFSLVENIHKLHANVAFTVNSAFVFREDGCVSQSVHEASLP